MCVATPGRVTAINGAMARIEFDGRDGWYNALATPDIQVDDWALTHAHMVVQTISEAEARDMLDAADELDRLLDAFDAELSGENGRPARDQ